LFSTNFLTGILLAYASHNATEEKDLLGNSPGKSLRLEDVIGGGYG